MILHAIVVEYVSTAEPVGSEALVSRYPLGVKSATVRNEMAELLDLGLIEQPHTSAGRIPSDLGYRYYVDRLVITKEIDTVVQDRLRTSAGDGEALQTVLRDTARLLSRLTRLLGVATTVREPNITIRTAVVSAIGPNQLLFVLALSNGHIENRMIEVPADLTLEHIGMANEALASHLVGQKLRLKSNHKAPATNLSPIADKVVSLAWNQLVTIAKSYAKGSLVVEGEEQLLTQPEFKKDVDTFATLMEELHDSDVLYQSLANSQSGQIVTIGRENPRAELKQFSIVRQSYYVGEDEAGVIAVVGPTRMKYDDGIPLVNFTAAALSESLTRFLGK
jgi:heat-inducible transcriptional repressor